MAKQSQKKPAAKQPNSSKLPWIVAAIVFVVTFLTVLLVFSQSGSDEDAPKSNGIGLHHAVIEIADYGTISLELDGDAAPITVQNFMDLANSGFYDGLTFHRIIDGFMMQGGEGSDGSAKNIKGEFSANGVSNPLSHTRGTISMARSKAPDSASSQFFIVHQDSPHLNGQYAAFGHVTEGMDVVDAICAAAQPIEGTDGLIAADQQPVITSIKIID